MPKPDIRELSEFPCSLQLEDEGREGGRDVFAVPCDAATDCAGKKAAGGGEGDFVGTVARGDFGGDVRGDVPAGFWELVRGGGEGEEGILRYGLRQKMRFVVGQ